MSRSSEPEISPCSGLALSPVISAPSFAAKPAPPICSSALTELSRTELGDAERLVRGEAGLFERVGEGIVANVVQEGRQPHREAVFVGDPAELAVLLERGEGAARQVIGAERVLETGMGGAGIDEEGVTDLADVAESLDRRRVEREQRRPVEADVVPEGVADDLQIGGSPPDHTRRARRRRSLGRLAADTARSSP